MTTRADDIAWKNQFAELEREQEAQAYLDEMREEELREKTEEPLPDAMMKFLTF